MSRSGQLCTFGPFLVDLEERQVKRDSEVVPMPAKAFDLLAIFLEQPGRTLGKNELLDLLWPDTAVEEGNLSQTVFLLRKALGETATSTNYIATAPRRGYKFTAPVNWNHPAEPSVRPRRRHHYLFAAGAVLLVCLLLATQIRASHVSVAVLPFVDSSPDKSLGYFCDGLTEQLIVVLARINGLRVPGRTSSFQFQGAKIGPKAIGSTLKVDHIIEGSVRSAGDRLRITARLVAVGNGNQLWAQTYERAPQDMFALEDEISRSVANALRVRVMPRAERKPTEDAFALQMYLLGRQLWFRRDFESAADRFRRAIGKDPGFALAYAGLARAYARMEGTSDTLRLAEDTARRALEIDETLSEAALVLATVRLREWDWPGAEREFRRALALDPRSAAAHGEYAIGYLAPMGYVEEALKESARSLELEPVSQFEHIRHGVLLTYARRYSVAEAQLRRAYLRWPDDTRRHLGRLYLIMRRYEQALEMFSDEPLWRAITLARAGRLAEARRVEFNNPDPAYVALYHAAIGETDRAMELLERARAAHAMSMTTLVSPWWDPLRTDARFNRLALSIGVRLGEFAVRGIRRPAV